MRISATRRVSLLAHSGSRSGETRSRAARMQAIALLCPSHPLAALAGTHQEPGMADGVGGVGSHLPQVDRPDQQVGGLARAPSSSASSAARRSAVNAATPSPACSRCNARSPRRRSSSTPSADTGSRWAAHAACTGAASPGRYVSASTSGQQRMSEPDALTDRAPPPRRRRPHGPTAEPRRCRGPRPFRQRWQFGGAARDRQDPGDLPRCAGQRPPGVQQRLAELVGQILRELGGVKAAPTYQQLAEVRVAPRPLEHLLHQAWLR